MVSKILSSAAIAALLMFSAGQASAASQSDLISLKGKMVKIFLKAICLYCLHGWRMAVSVMGPFIALSMNIIINSLIDR